MVIKQMVVPKFASEREEAAWWDAHRSEVESEIRRRMRKKTVTLEDLLRKEKPSQPITLRIAKEDLETARRLAAGRGLGYQTYMKMLLRAALAEQTGRGEARIEIAARAASGKRVAKRGA